MAQVFGAGPARRKIGPDGQILAHAGQTVEHEIVVDDAYSLMSVAADFAVTQVVDGRQGIHCRIARGVFHHDGAEPVCSRVNRRQNDCGVPPRAQQVAWHRFC